MTICVMCCGCRGVLQNDGTTLVWDPTVAQPQARVFATVEEADAFLPRLGWEIAAEGKPDNHRCPMCRPAAAKVNRIGAFLDSSSVTTAKGAKRQEVTR